MPRKMSSTLHVRAILAALACAGFAGTAAAAIADVDPERFMAPDEIRAGMKGFGLTVMSGTTIERFEFEVLGVMHNDFIFYADQDVILARCSGLNLDHTGIIGGMSGSPCYIRDDATGRERLIGAIAYGWSLQKEPICGIQPITQMLPIARSRQPENRPKQVTGADDARGRSGGPQARGKGIALPELIARVWHGPIPKASRFSVFNDALAKMPAPEPRPAAVRTAAAQLQPLHVPVMFSGTSGQALAQMQDEFHRLGIEPVLSGGASPADRAKADGVKLEPGSVLAASMITGDLNMDALGTCTYVGEDGVLAFGHTLSQFGTGEGWVEMPMATGTIHTVLASISRSNKMGAPLKTVGTVWGDENFGIFGTLGKGPDMIPVDVEIQDVRDRRAYHYDVVHHTLLTPLLIGIGMLESVYAHNVLPEEHTVRYAVETEFEGLGMYRSSSLTSQSDVSAVRLDVLLPMMALMGAPFEQARVGRVRVEITIEPRARLRMMTEVTLPRLVYKPGETVTARVRWLAYREGEAFSESSYDLTLPDDLPDGEYAMTVGSSRAHLSALLAAKPHLFYAESMKDILQALNLTASFPDDRVYMRLQLQEGGVAVKRVEMPELPSFRRKILADSGRTDLTGYSEALVAEHEAGFAVEGGRSFKIQVSRRADQ